MTDFEIYMETRAKRQKASTARRERIIAARQMGVHTDAEFHAMCELVGWHCVKCLGHCPDGLTRDHIVPLHQGGSDGIANIQPLCRSCNSSKPADETCNYLLRHLGLA